MKGNQIKKLRESFELSAADFAELVGVQASSVYRWEDLKNKTVPVEGIARKLLQLLSDLKDKERETVVKQLRRGGWMAGIHSLLGLSMKKS